MAESGGRHNLELSIEALYSIYNIIIVVDFVSTVRCDLRTNFFSPKLIYQLRIVNIIVLVGLIYYGYQDRDLRIH